MPAAWAADKAVAACDADVQSRTKRQTASCQTAAQRLPIDVFHDDEVLPVAGLLECVDRTNVGMIEAGGGACLLLESAYSRAVAGQPNRQQLDRDLSPESSVGREPDFTHAAGAEGVDELVVIDARA